MVIVADIVIQIVLVAVITIAVVLISVIALVCCRFYHLE